MITASETARLELVTPTTPTERRVFERMTVGSQGALLVLSAQVAGSGAHLIVRSSQDAATLEELFRMLRIRLRDQEQLQLVEPVRDHAAPLGALHGGNQ